MTENELAQILLDEFLEKKFTKHWINMFWEWQNDFSKPDVEDFAIFCAQKILEKEKFLKEIIKQRNELRDAHWE